MTEKRAYIPLIIIAMLSVAYYTASFSSPWTRDIFYVCGYICIIYVLSYFFNKNKKNQTNITLTISLFLFLFGIARLAWVIHYQQNNDMLHGIYDAYQATSKRLIIGAFIISTIILLHNRMQPIIHIRLIRILIKILPIIVMTYALYQFSIMGMERIELSTNRATATAYIITPLFLISLYICLREANRHKDILFTIINLCASTITILLTQTRAAILVYLTLAIITIVWMLRSKVSWKYTAVILCSILVILTISYRPIIQPRIAEAIHETENYNIETASGSFNSRFAMWHAGIYAFKQHPLGQSADSRYELINHAVEQQTISSFIVQFLNVHLHNEIIDTLSLQGVFGALLLIFIYLSLLISSVVKRNFLLFIITLSLGGFGLSDVLLFSQEVTITYIICIALALLLGSQREEHEYRPL